MKKTACVAVFLMLCTFLFPSLAHGATEGYAFDFDVTANAVYLYNMDNDMVITAVDADVPLPPASLTKIMTCILALENTADLDKEILTYPNYVQDYLYTYQRQVGAVSLAGDLRAGDQLTMRQALYALMLPSANEVAMIIADHIGGSQEGFAQLMNQRAKELGAQNTNFVNPNGLYDPAHLTTAYDLAQITLHALTIPEFVEITSATSYDSGPTNRHENMSWRSTNEMMMPESSYYYPSLKGVKTGSLPQAGRCFVSTATKDGFSYLLVVLGSDYYDTEGNMITNKQMAFDDTAKIYNWVFNTFRVKTLVDKGKHVEEIPLRLSLQQDHIKLMTADRFTALLPDYIDVSRDVDIVATLPDRYEAPVKKGQPIGHITLSIEGQELGQVQLLAAETVEASTLLVVLDKVKKVTSSFAFKFILVFLVLLIAFYVFVTIMRNRKRRKGGYRPRRRI